MLRARVFEHIPLPGTASPRNSAGRARSCYPPPRPASPARWSRWTAVPSARS